MLDYKCKVIHRVRGIGEVLRDELGFTGTDAEAQKLVSRARDEAPEDLSMAKRMTYMAKRIRELIKESNA